MLESSDTLQTDATSRYSSFYHDHNIHRRYRSSPPRVWHHDTGNVPHQRNGGDLVRISSGEDVQHRAKRQGSFEGEETHVPRLFARLVIIIRLCSTLLSIHRQPSISRTTPRQYIVSKQSKIGFKIDIPLSLRAMLLVCAVHKHGNPFRQFRQVPHSLVGLK